MTTKKLNLLLFLIIILSSLFTFGCNKNQNHNENYSKYNYKIIHSIKEKTYDKIELFSDESGSIEKYNELKSQGYKCIKDDNAMGGDLICYNVRGYTHEYEISGFKLKIIGYYNHFMNNISDNPGILYKNIESPFILSGNTVYDTYDSGISYIQYFEFKEGEIAEDVLSKAKRNRDDGFIFSNKIGINKEGTGKYLLSFSKKDGKGRDYMDLLYYFNPDKNYYYVINYGEDCNPGPCGISRHGIEFFYE